MEKTLKKHWKNIQVRFTEKALNCETKMTRITFDYIKNIFFLFSILI